MASISFRRTWLILLATLSWLPSLLAVADDLSCLGSRPLFEMSWTELTPANHAGIVGEWRLPLSAERPEIITEARMSLSFDWVQAAEGYQVNVAFSFPDPKPFGLPFTFQRVELAWSDSAGPHVIDVDWSGACTGPGRSLFPGNRWFTPVGEPLPGSAPLVQPHLRIWGSRN